MSVLTAVFAHAWHISADVSGLEIGGVERRIEKLDQCVLATNQARIHGVHRHARARGIVRRRIAPPNSAQPNRSDIRHCHGNRAESRRRSMRGDTTRHPRRSARFVAVIAPPPFRNGPRTTGRYAFAPLWRILRARGKGRMPSHTLSPLAVPADEIHAVVPVTGSDQRQAMRAESETVQNRSYAVLIDIRAFVGLARQVVVRVVLRLDRAAFEKGRGFVENRRVAGGQNVAACRQWQPKVVVGTMRAHAAPGRRMPPVLDVAFDELTARTEHDLRAHERAARRAPGPSRPATGRGNRRRRPTGSSRCAPTVGRPSFGRRASRWSAR